MSVDIVTNALLFWHLVELSLVRFYGWEREAAHERVLSLRGRMTKAAIVQDITYHWQPIHVAGDIAYDLRPLSDEQWAAWLEMVGVETDRWRADASSQVAPTEAKLSASKKSRPVAAMAR